MPSSSSVHRTLAKKKRSGPTHREVMQKRHEKRRKKEKRDLKHKKMNLLKEYKRLCDIESLSKKDTAMKVMEIIEEIKEEGMNDQKYLQMMDMLMNLHKEESEGHLEETHHIRPRNLYNTHFRDFYYDRVGDNLNIINEREDIIDTLNENIIRADIIINNIERNLNNTGEVINNDEEVIVDNTVRDGWERVGQGTWRRIEGYINEENNPRIPIVDDY
jgi:hypothetical protein